MVNFYLKMACEEIGINASSDSGRQRGSEILQGRIALVENSLRKIIGTWLSLNDQLMTEERRREFGRLGVSLGHLSPKELEFRDGKIVPLLERAFEEGISKGGEILATSDSPEGEIEALLSILEAGRQIAITNFQSQDLGDLVAEFSEERSGLVLIWALAGGNPDYIKGVWRGLSDRQYSRMQGFTPAQYATALETGVALGIARRLIYDVLRGFSRATQDPLTTPA
jgi:hypothetical protein